MTSPQMPDTLLALCLERDSTRTEYYELARYGNPGVTVHDRVTHDIAVRKAMRAMMAAEDAYNAALDKQVTA